MRPSSLCAVAGLIGIAFALSAYSGGGRVENAPPVVPYVCDCGQSASAIYDNGGVFRQARLRLTIDGRTSEMMAAPTLYGSRYLGEPTAEQPRRLIWTLRGEDAWLAEAVEPYRSDREGPRLLNCRRQRHVAGAHGEDHH